MAKLWCAKCTICSNWHYIGEMPLVWQESEGVFRGICSLDHEAIEDKAKELDWETHE